MDTHCHKLGPLDLWVIQLNLAGAVSATNMTMFPPHNKHKESNEKPVESHLFPMVSGHSLLLRATDLGIVREIKALIHKHWQSPNFLVFLCEF